MSIVDHLLRAILQITGEKVYLIETGLKISISKLILDTYSMETRSR